MFHDPAQYVFSRALCAEAPTIRAELDRIPENDFVPWLETDLYEGDGWRVSPLLTADLYRDGPYAELVPMFERNVARCPRTVALLTGLPGCVLAGFSLMKPGTHILPHHGSERGVYRCHLCLVDAEDSALAFGDDVREWREGECLVFEDTVMHEAWNRGSRSRIVLLADFQKAAYDG